MKIIKHISIALLAGVGIFVLCSAGNNTTKQEIIKNTIEGQEIDLPSNPNTAFKEGEILTYRLHYGVIDAGVATLEVKPSVLDISGRKVYHIVGNGNSKGSFDWFYKVRDRYETYIDKDALVPWMFVRRVDEGGVKFSQ